MNKFIADCKNLSNYQCIFILTIVGILIAWRVNYIQHGWVNRDFVIYYESARLFSIGEWKAGFTQFEWPLYSLLISGIHKITGIDLAFSARILSVVLYALTTFSFLSIINMSNGNKVTLSCGAIILFSAPYLTGDILPMLLRDPGQWAFFLTSLIFFIRFYKYHLIKDALFWQLSAIIAVLFRIETITYLILLPSIILISPNLKITKRITLMLQAHAINFSILIILTLIIWLSPGITVDNLGRLKEIPYLFSHKYLDTIKELNIRIHLLETVVLKNNFDDLGGLGLSAAFLAISAFKCASTTGWINTGLCIYGHRKQTGIDSDTHKILITTAILAILNAFIILMSVFLLVGRYLAPLALVLMVMASFVLSDLIHKSFINKDKIYAKKFVVAIIVLMMTLSLVKELLPKQKGYNFQQDAVSWLKKYNNHDKKVFYDDSKVRYFANESFIGAWGETWTQVTSAVENHLIKENEYLVITHYAKYPEREDWIKKQLPEYKEIKRFYSTKKRKSIVIYQKSPSN